MQKHLFVLSGIVLLVLGIALFIYFPHFGRLSVVAKEAALTFTLVGSSLSIVSALYGGFEILYGKGGIRYLLDRELNHTYFRTRISEAIAVFLFVAGLYHICMLQTEIAFITLVLTYLIAKLSNKTRKRLQRVERIISKGYLSAANARRLSTT